MALTRIRRTAVNRKKVLTASQLGSNCPLPFRVFTSSSSMSGITSRRPRSVPVRRDPGKEPAIGRQRRRRQSIFPAQLPGENSDVRMGQSTPGINALAPQIVAICIYMSSPRLTIISVIFLENHSTLPANAERRQRSDDTDGFFYGKISSLKHSDHFAEIVRQRIARSQNVELFLDEEFGLVCNGFLRIPDVYDTASKCDFFNSSTECLGQPNRFYDDIGPPAISQFR